MNQDQVNELIQYRLQQASETLREGEILAREKLWHGVVNRAYYSMFYSILDCLGKPTTKDNRSQLIPALL